MEQISIEIHDRSEQGSSGARRIRREGFIPCVVYSHGNPSVSGTVSAREFVRLAKRVRSSQIFTLKSGRAELDGRSAIVKEIQEQFTSAGVYHVDFQTLRDDETVTVRIPLRFFGESPGVKTENGILSVGVHELAVECLPKSIPEELSVDVSGLHLGESIHAGAIELPAGVELHGEADETIVSIVAMRVAEATTATPAEGATAEGATPAGSEAGTAGAAPASGAAAAPAKASGK